MLDQFVNGGTASIGRFRGRFPGFPGEMENVSYCRRGEPEPKGGELIEHGMNGREMSRILGTKQDSCRAEQGNIQVKRGLPRQFVVQNHPGSGMLQRQ